MHTMVHAYQVIDSSNATTKQHDCNISPNDSRGKEGANLVHGLGSLILVQRLRTKRFDHVVHLRHQLSGKQHAQWAQNGMGVHTRFGLASCIGGRNTWSADFRIRNDENGLIVRFNRFAEAVVQNILLRFPYQYVRLSWVSEDD